METCSSRVPRMRSGSTRPQVAAIFAAPMDLPEPRPPFRPRYRTAPLGGEKTRAMGSGSRIFAVAMHLDSYNLNSGDPLLVVFLTHRGLILGALGRRATAKGRVVAPLEAVLHVHDPHQGIAAAAPGGQGPAVTLPPDEAQVMCLIDGSLELLMLLEEGVPAIDVHAQYLADLDVAGTLRSRLEHQVPPTDGQVGHGQDRLGWLTRGARGRCRRYLWRLSLRWRGFRSFGRRGFGRRGFGRGGLRCLGWFGCLGVGCHVGTSVPRLYHSQVQHGLHTVHGVVHRCTWRGGHGECAHLFLGFEAAPV